MTALESALSGQETTTKPTNLRLHSRASRLTSRACGHMGHLGSLHLLTFRVGVRGNVKVWAPTPITLPGVQDSQELL